MLDYSKKEIDWLLTEIDLSIENKIIDVACGSGRHLKAFLQNGFSPVGIDVSPDCISSARLNCPEIASRILEVGFLEFAETVCSDFGLVFIAGSSFGYDTSLDVNMQFLNKLLDLTSLGGFLVIQFLNKTWAQTSIKSKIAFWSDDSEYYILDKREINEEILKSEKIFLRKNSDFQKVYADEIFMFTSSQILNLVFLISDKLNKKFQLIKLADSFSSTPYDEKKSATPVLILKRIE